MSETASETAMPPLEDRMFYKSPGDIAVDGGTVQALVSNDYEQAVKDGWFFTTTEAIAAVPKKLTEKDRMTRMEEKLDAILAAVTKGKKAPE